MTSQKHCTKKKLNLTVQMKADILQQWIDADLTIGNLLDLWGTLARQKLTKFKNESPTHQSETFLVKRFCKKAQADLLEEMMKTFRTNHEFLFDVLKDRYCLKKIKTSASDSNDLHLAIQEFKYFFTEFVELNFKELKEQEICKLNMN